MADSYQSIINQLKQILQEECRVQADYVKVLAEETAAMSPFRAEDVERLNMQRSELCDEMNALQERRRVLVEMLTNGEETKLSEAIEKRCLPRDKQALFPLVSRLKVLIHKSRSDTRDFDRLNSFSLGLVNSLISLMSSGKQGVTRFYSGKGIIKEAFHPSSGRLNAVLKQA
ncbi:MAG: flagellar protein FlgN [SAR324 cluster bacterium]|uniref:Flagellar protein FlgN n=1 Tax=SAR324 cluster bacterium TaxID=2024889 RepID=A0A7X9FPE1_9DELT|nr:flagellar protein FlgN [SAR324 cluster bacterium]